MINPDELQVRHAQVDDVDVEQGIVQARLMPYETEVELEPGWSEVFTRAAFAAAVANPSRCKVSDQGHQRRIVIGQATELRDAPDGLYGRLKIADTTQGRDVLTLLREKILTELSVEFRMQKRHLRISKRAGGVLYRHDKAVLVGVSPVAAGAYGDAARVLSVREDAEDHEREQILAELYGLTAGPDRATVA